VSLPGASTTWVIGQWSTLNGRFAYAGDPPLNLVNQYCGSNSGGKAGPPGAVFTQCLAPHGYVQWTSYQPASRLWPFQWIEGGGLLALSALLIAVTVWLVQRRAA
jgi:protein-S-isoprenylcysteine O-methyltransferase Ste14